MVAPARAVLGFARDGDVFVARSLEEAEGFMEAVDVDEGEYEALYTLDGHLLAVSTENQAVLVAETGESDESGLRRRLEQVVQIHHLSSAPGDVRGVANELLQKQWERRWPRPPRWLAKRLGIEAPRI